VVAGSSGVLVHQATGGTTATTNLWYSADGSTYSNIASHITSTFGVTRVYRVVWTGTYFYLFCASGILLRSTTGASGSWSVATATLGLGTLTNTDPYGALPDNLQYRYLTDGTYHIIKDQYSGTFWFSSDFINWSYAQARTANFMGVVGTTFIGLTVVGTSMSTYTLTGNGYTTATQFPVPNLNLPQAAGIGTASPPPVPYIKT
jgi:hypothetical protein